MAAALLEPLDAITDKDQDGDVAADRTSSPGGGESQRPGPGFAVATPRSPTTAR
jgi:hypothetical protein